jgi:hypothetical protein
MVPAGKAHMDVFEPKMSIDAAANSIRRQLLNSLTPCLFPNQPSLPLGMNGPAGDMADAPWPRLGLRVG